MATSPGSDQGPAQIDPGAYAPDAQPPIGTAVLPLGLENPQVLPLPPQGDLGAPVQRPGRIISSIPPLNPPGGLNISQSSHTLPLSLPSSAQPNQANLVPIVAIPLLSRIGDRIKPAWGAIIPIAGLSSVTVRATYHDLKIMPGFRGIQLAFPTAPAGVVSVICNSTKATLIVPAAAGSFFLPLYMLFDLVDLTLSIASGSFPANSTALLLTEEQLPAEIK